MRLSILGYKQSDLINFGIGIEEVMILRHFADFCTSPKMKHINYENEIYYWISYKKVLEDLPILNLNERTLSTRYEKLVKANLLKKHVDKTRSGSYTYFKFTDSYFKLMENVENNHIISEVKEPKNKKNNMVDKFDDFYSIYPNKKNRGRAETAFKKMVKDDKTLELIISDLENRKNCYDWVKENGRYIPHPSSYLNAKGWLDEYETTKKKETVKLNIQRY